VLTLGSDDAESKGSRRPIRRHAADDSTGSIRPFRTGRRHTEPGHDWLRPHFASRTSLNWGQSSNSNCTGWSREHSMSPPMATRLPTNKLAHTRTIVAGFLNTLR
jgi:hypothetical protein